MLPLEEFKSIIWDYYKINKRNFAWRETQDPYHIMVSEIMLQQTQTDRVIHKFNQFITAFPTIKLLAQASLKDVLTLWQGLGYNRRGLALHASAQKVIHEYNGALPNDPQILVTFPGIGKATASSICAFAFNRPTVFIETNIRSVYIHFFFNDSWAIKDVEIFPLVQASIINEPNPREWYYALMDYGVMLKKKLPNPSRKSAHHCTQSKFEGSDRQIRGMILKIATQQNFFLHEELFSLIEREPVRIEKALQELVKEGFIKNINNGYMVS